MKRKLLTTSVFLFGLVLGGASASASSPSKDAPVPSITPEMSACLAACQNDGQTFEACWACCVRNICGAVD
ncbi:hypothetical protein JYK02_13880 [Corallococcus macrosporus]|uniref:Uncharacterized protein n=1 Tax=Corallococcus macrosporus TaxID=35 RepID=A0ABS3DCE6_9BACT|nr:hypothetical protein [Corallococcus macrosporus]MBN8228597.1 hypothetical protein [Corallococcus macrosporus]